MHQVTLALTLLIGLSGCHSTRSTDAAAVVAPSAACDAPARPDHFPDSAGVVLTTANLRLSPAKLVGRYQLVLATLAGENETLGMELALPGPGDSAWSSDRRRDWGRAPTLLGAADVSHTVRVPDNGYVIVRTGDGRLGVQADITEGGSLIFTLGDHLYGGKRTIFQTTETRRYGWAGWWWYPAASSGYGYFCLRRSAGADRVK
jgi:hypothetical protein